MTPPTRNPPHRDGGPPKRILIIGLNFSPELVGVGKYTGEMAESLAAAGHAVRVVTAPPYYPMWRRAAGWPRYAYRRERLSAPPGSLEAWRCPLYVPARPGGGRRLVHLASFALSSLPAALWQAAWRPQVVIAIAPALFSAPVALLAARLCGARAWLHIQDFEIDAAFELGMLGARPVRGLVSACERWLMRRFDRVSTISDKMCERLLAKGCMPERVALLPNWVDTNAIFPGTDSTALRTEIGLGTGRVVALYSGSMGEKQGLDIVIEAARLLADEPIDFVLCGDGPARARLQQLGAGLRNLRFVPLQPLERLNELLNLADIHLLPQRADIADLVMPSKLTAMLASGKPVVATAHAGTQVARTVEDCGLVVPPGDATAFATAIAQLAGDPVLRVRFGGEARARAEQAFGRARILATLDADLRSLAG